MSYRHFGDCTCGGLQVVAPVGFPITVDGVLLVAFAILAVVSHAHRLSRISEARP